MKKILNILLTIALIGVISLIGFFIAGVLVIQDKYEPKSFDLETKENQDLENKLKVNTSKNVDLDTILEISNPKQLDLSKHQLFIDTTKTNKFYNSASEWNNGLKLTNRKLKLADFPTKFITLRKLNDNFILYDRCDGSDPRIIILDSTIVIYGPLEKSVERIKEISISDNKIKLNEKSSKTKITIEKTDSVNVYKINFENHWLDWIEYVTPLNNIEEFELLVNHCPKRKVMEFKGFD